MTTPVGRVEIAPDDGPLVWEPDWDTPLDATENLVAGIDISRGRQTEAEQTDTSTALVYVNDTAGIFDPANTGSDYFNKVIGRQIRLAVRNPVTSTWVPQWRGVIDDLTFDLHPAGVVSNVQIQCVDLFDYLAGVEMIPGLFGQTPPTGSEGVVFYEDGDWQTRIENLLADADIDPDQTIVFTGNVDVQETKYDPGDSLLIALRDACDAEFPSIANMYTDKLGRFCAHGREACFDPDGTSAEATPGAWDFTRWKAGDGAAIVLDSNRAQIRPPFRWSRPRKRVVNSAICYPRGVAEADIPGQIVTDAPSIAEFGYRSWNARDLITQAGTTTGNTATEECRLFAEWKVANYKEPRTLVDALTFKSLRPGDTRATKTWALICGADIADVIDLEAGYAGGEGISEEFDIQGSEMQIRPLNPDHDMVTLSLNVSPRAYYADDVFTS